MSSSTSSESGGTGSSEGQSAPKPAAKTSARLPFDPSYPAHLKVLLGSLARSVGQGQGGLFAECLHNCLDYLIRYWLGANLGGLNHLGKAPFEVPESLPPLEEAVRLLHYSAFAWESMPDEPMRQLLRLGFYESQSPPVPRLHARWLGMAGDPLPEGIASVDLSQWEAISDRIMARRVAYLQVLSSFLSASRPLFQKYHRKYTFVGDVLTLELAYEGTGDPFPFAPSLPWDLYGPRMSLIQVQAVERSTTLPLSPASTRPATQTAVAPPPAAVVPASPPPPVEAPSPPKPVDLGPMLAPPNTPVLWQSLLNPLNALLAKAQDEEEWAKEMPALASQLVSVLTDLVGVLAGLLLGQLRRRGPLPEPLEAALRAFQEPEQRLKLIHFSWQAAFGSGQIAPGDSSLEALRAVFVDRNGLPLTHSRWLGLPDSLLQGLGHLAFWTRVAQRELPHLGREEAQQQLSEVWSCLASALQALEPLWEGEWSRRDDGCLTATLRVGDEFWSLEDGLPEESAPELVPREPRPLGEVIQDLQVLQQRGTAPYFIVDEICEFVSSPGGGSGMVISGPLGSGKSFLLTHLLEEQRQLLQPISPGVTSCDCSWLYCDDSPNFLLESLNEAIAFHRWRGDCDWEPLAPPALADLHRHSDGGPSASGEEEPAPDVVVPLRAFLHSLWFRNQPRSSTQKIAFLLDELNHSEAEPWSSTSMPAHFSWVAATDKELPAGWSSVYPPARLPMPVQDATYKRFLLEHLHAVFGGEREQWSALVQRSAALSDTRLQAGLLSRGLARKLEQVPTGPKLYPFLFTRLRLNQEQKRFLVFLAWAGAVPTALVETCGFDEREVALLVDLFPWLFLLREEVVGRAQEDWEGRLSYISLGHPEYATAVLEHVPLDARVVVGGVVDHLSARLESWPTSLDFLSFLAWARLAQSPELGWKLLSLEAVRKRREQICATFESQRRPHRKVIVLSSWIEFLGSLQLADCPQGLEDILQDILLEEQLWAFSSRALTYRSMGRLNEALEDIEHSIAEFRTAVASNSSLLNGLAAAHNRRSEILRERSRFREALRDAHEAVSAYERVLAQSDRAHLEPLLALALHNRGVILQELGCLEEAEADMERALERYRPWQDSLNSRVRLDLAKALRERGRLALLREDPIQSRDDSVRVLKLLDRFEESWAELRVERAQAQHQLAEAYLAIEEETRALEASDRAAEIWEGLVQEGRLDLRALYAQELNHRSQLLLDLGKVDEAAAAVETAADLHQQLVDDEGRSDLHEHLSRSLLLRGRVWQRSGKWEAAKRDYTLACHYLSLPTSQGVGLRRQSRDALVETGVHLAGLHFHLNDYESAVTQTRATLSLLEGEMSASVPTLEKKARLLDLLGRSLILQNTTQPLDQENALGAHDKAVDLLSELVDVQGHYHLLPRLAEAHLGRARTRRHLAQEQAALEDANTAVELLAFLSEKGGDPGVLAMLGPARLEAAELLWSLGESERAFKHVQDALSDYEMYNEEGQAVAVNMASPRILRGKLHLEAGRWGEALADFEDSLLALRDLQQRGWDVEAQIAECLLLKAEAAMPSERPAEVARDVLEAFDEGSSMADSWDSFEKLLRRVHDEARQHLAQENPQSAWEAYSQLLDLIRKAEVCASTEELQPYRIRTYQERALVRIQDSSSTPEALEEARIDLTMALKLSALSAASGGRDDLLLLAQVYETRASLLLRQGRPEFALADLGRGLEALFEINPSDQHLEGRLLELYSARIELARELDDTAGEWRDLGQMRTLLRTSIALGEGENLRTLIGVVNRRAQLLQSMELSQLAMEEGRECLRLLSKLQQLCEPDEQQGVVQQMVALHLHLATPQANRDWERESFDLVGHLCEAIELAAYQGAYSWISTELLQEALGKAAPLCAAKLSLTILRVFALQDGAEAWGEVLAAALQRCNWDDLPYSLTTALFQRWRAWAFEPTGRWVGEAFRVLSGFPLRRLKESTEACQALRACLEAWCDLPSHQLALLGVPQERLAAMAQDLAGVSAAGV